MGRLRVTYQLWGHCATIRAAGIRPAKYWTGRPPRAWASPPGTLQRGYCTPASGTGPGRGSLPWPVVLAPIVGTLAYLWDRDTDRHFLPLVFDDDPRPFHGDMPYEGDRAVGWTFERL